MISLEETKKYPFVLAVTDCDKCFNPIFVNYAGVKLLNQYIDRAFVTTAGGYSVIPADDPGAPEPEKARPGDDFLLTYPLTLRSAQGPWVGYTYWILKDGKCSCTFLRYTSEEINKAIKKELDEIELDDPSKHEDSEETKDFVSAVQKFLNFSTKSNDVATLKTILEELEKAEGLNLEERDNAYFRSKFYYDTGEPKDDNLGIKYYDGFLLFECEYWDQSLQLIKDAAAFEWDKEFAYCDLAGRAEHIAELNNIFANRINCLFYVKWEEILKWYCKYMQPRTFAMVLPDVQSTTEMAELEKLCKLKIEQHFIPDFTYYFHTAGQWSRYQCKDMVKNSHHEHQYYDTKSKKLVTVQYKAYEKITSAGRVDAWETIPPLNKSVDSDKFLLVFKNLYWLSSQNKINESDLKFNSSIIAKQTRVFSEFILKVLYYLGYIPMASIKNTICFEYYLPEQDRVNSSICDVSKIDIQTILTDIEKTKKLYTLQPMLKKLHSLTDDKVNELMHQNGCLDSANVKDILNTVYEITTWVLKLLNIEKS